MSHVREPRTRTSTTAHVAKAQLVALLLLAATALVACGGSKGNGADTAQTKITPGRTGGTIVWGKSAEALDSDPVASGSASSWQIFSRVYEGLVGIDDELKPVPKLAESWEQTSPTTWVFTIRRGVTFSNGRQLTIDDVVGSLRRLVEPKTASYWVLQLGKVKSIRAKGDAQVEIVLAEPNAGFLGGLAGVPASIMPMKELNDGSFNPKKELLGTGPFKVALHRQDEVWQLVRNPHYWQKDQPKADRLTIRIMPDDAARIAGLRDGSVDVVNFDTSDTMKLLKGQANVKTAVVPTTDFYIIDVNAKTGLFKDPRLREALALSIDRGEVNDVALGGTSKPSASSSSAFGVCDPADMPYGKPDPGRAAQLVEAAGAKGKTVRFMAANNYKPYGQIAQVLQQRLEQAGMKVKVEQPDEGAMFTRLGKADFDLNMEYFAGFADPAMTLLWYSEANPFNDGWYVGGGDADPALERPIAQARAASESAARGAAIRTACEQAAKGALIIPLLTKPAFLAYRTDKLEVPVPKIDTTSDPLNGIAGYAVKGG